jgi:hypothetical protein
MALVTALNKKFDESAEVWKVKASEAKENIQKSMKTFEGFKADIDSRLFLGGPVSPV